MIEKLLKEEQKLKRNKENLTSARNSCVIDNPLVLPVLEVKAMTVEDKSKQDELDASLFVDDIDFSMEIDKVEKAAEKIVVVQNPVVLPPAPKPLASDPTNVSSSIFKELESFDFDTEITEEELGQIDFDTVSTYIDSLE